MNDPKKHHFSAQFYLRGWCNADSKIIEYTRPYRKVVAKPVSPEATGFKEFLYTLDEAPDDARQNIETKYMAPIVDNRGALAVKILIELDRNKLTDDVRRDFTRFLLASIHRTPDNISRITKEFTENIRQNLNADPTLYKTLQPGDPPTPYEWLEKNRPHLVTDIAKQAALGNIEIQRISDIVINMEWWTFDLQKSGHELMTSDAPFLRTTGLGYPTCLIAFPLSPRFLFVAAHDERISNALLECGETAIVRWVNDNTARAAKHYVYARTKSHLQFVEKRLCLPGTFGPIVPPY